MANIFYDVFYKGTRKTIKVDSHSMMSSVLESFISQANLGSNVSKYRLRYRKTILSLDQLASNCIAPNHAELEVVKITPLSSIRVGIEIFHNRYITQLPSESTLLSCLSSIQSQHSVHIIDRVSDTGHIFIPILNVNNKCFSEISELCSIRLHNISVSSSLLIKVTFNDTPSNLTMDDINSMLVTDEPIKIESEKEPMHTSDHSLVTAQSPTLSISDIQSIITEIKNSISNTSDLITTLESLKVITRNLIKDKPQYKQLNSSNPIFAQRVGLHQKAMKYLFQIGFVTSTDSLLLFNDSIPPFLLSRICELFDVEIEKSRLVLNMITDSTTCIDTSIVEVIVPNIPLPSIEHLHRIISSLVKSNAPRTLRLDNEVFHSFIGQYEQSMELLALVGFKHVDNCLVLSDDINFRYLSRIVELLSNILAPPTVDSTVNVSIPQVAVDFDRQLRVFDSPSKITTSTTLPSLQEDEKLSEKQIARESMSVLMAAAKDAAKKKAVEEQLSMRPAHVRESFKSSMRRKYSKTVIRISFLDLNTILQASFLPSEPVSVLFDFVSSCLAQPIPEFSFLVPPNNKITKLDPIRSLSQASLVPTAQLIIKSSFPPLLLDSLIAKREPFEAVEVPVGELPEQPQIQTKEVFKPPPKPMKKSGKKIPKWMK